MSKFVTAVLLLVCLVAASYSARVSNGATLQTTTAVNVRSGPCTTNSIVTSLSAGEQVQYTGQAASGCGYTWYGVKGSFGSGYVASNYVTEVVSYLSATTAVNVRSGPCTSNSIITTLSSGDRVQFTGETTTGCGYTWKGVKGSFGSGYAVADYLSQNSNGGGSSSGGSLTAAGLRTVMPNLSSSKANQYIGYLNDAMASGSVNTCCRMSAFLAQLAHESGDLNW